MSKKGAKGGGNIRKKTVIRNGKPYTYWEARITTGRDPGTGKQIQRSFTGKTQKEVREKLQAAAVAVNDGTYTDPSRLTMGQWLDIWQREYIGYAKTNTLISYRAFVKNHIRPGLGAVRLKELHPHMIQHFINNLTRLDGKGPLSPVTVLDLYKVLHVALEKAVELDYIPKNPADHCVLPRMEREEIHPLTDEQAAAMIQAAAGKRIEHLVTLALFTGFRLSEMLGLTWDAVDFGKGTITVDKQLAADFINGPMFATPKSGKPRIVTPAASAFQVLRKQKAKQAEQQLKAGPLWSNPYGLVFTDDDGGPLKRQVAEYEFAIIRDAVGLDGSRIHDLRHTYAVNSIRAGDDIKTIQRNLGHERAAFTLDVYGHVTEIMKQDSAARMETFIKNVMKL